MLYLSRSLAVATLLLVAGHRESAAQPPCVQPSAAKVRAAMLSVYYAAYQPYSKPTNWKPVSLDEASETLRCDASFGARARRRRAIIKLAPRMVQQGVGLTALSLSLAAAIGAALDNLGVDVGDLIGFLQGSGATQPIQLEHATAQYLQTSGGPFPLCCARVTYCEVKPPTIGSDTDPSSVFFTIDVARPLNDVKQAMDPQTWDDCEGTYFESTVRVGSTCPTTPPTGTPVDVPETPGSTWSGALFEHFEADFNGGNRAMFQNFLKIDAKSGSDFRYDYGLCTPLGSLETDVLGTHDTPGKLREDCGFSRVGETATNQSVVSGIKVLQFDPIEDVQGLGIWAHLGLEYLVDQIADVGVCCGEDTLEPPVCPDDATNWDQDCFQAKPSSKQKLKWPATALCK